MDTVHFLGRVWPATVNVSISYKPHINWKEPQINFEATFIINVDNSIVDIECRVPKWEPNEVGLLFERAYDKVRAAVALVSFAEGQDLGVIMEEMIAPDGTRSRLTFPYSQLAPLCTAYQIGSNPKAFDEIYKLVQTDFELFLALNDLIAPLVQPALSEINCGRVLDGLRRMIAPAVSNYGAAWNILHRELNISRSYREFVTSLSAKPRHGDRMAMNTPQAGEAMRRTWIIFDRFLHYRMGGNKRLEPPQFPSL